eukprot:8645525-Pyramimonas_sp.AAC.1
MAAKRAEGSPLNAQPERIMPPTYWRGRWAHLLRPRVGSRSWRSQSEGQPRRARPQSRSWLNGGGSCVLGGLWREGRCSRKI